MHATTRMPRAMVLAGPTASGKSALAMAIAEQIPLEIVSVDSAQVYRGLDIGTAKPSAAERARVPHHLIDIVEPTEAYSAARFAADAVRLIGEIHARGRAALLVGGTMLYVKALIDGLDALPERDPAVRAALDARAAAHGWPALHAELAQVDPVTARRLQPNDGQRIQRALEVWHLTRRPLSQAQGRRLQPGLKLPLLSLEPRSRAWLHERIAARFHAMLRDGLVDEVRALRARGDLRPELPSMRCVGYRQVWQALDAGDLSGLAERGIAATRQLAKRQLTWLRSLSAQRVACDDAQAAAQVLAKAREWLSTPP
jgi:tRNA dimethylallyltransferase